MQRNSFFKNINECLQLLQQSFLIRANDFAALSLVPQRCPIHCERGCTLWFLNAPERKPAQGNQKNMLVAYLQVILSTDPRVKKPLSVIMLAQ